jgi:hypothetical protein
MVGGRRAFFPEMDLSVDDQHWRFPFSALGKLTGCSRKALPNATLN